MFDIPDKQKFQLCDWHSAKFCTQLENTWFVDTERKQGTVDPAIILTRSEMPSNIVFF